MSKVIEMADVLTDFRGSMTALAEHKSPYLQARIECPDGSNALWVAKQMQGSWTYIDVDVDKAHRNVKSLLSAVLIAGMAIHVKISPGLEVWITRYSTPASADGAAAVATSLWNALLDNEHTKSEGRTVSEIAVESMRLKLIQGSLDVMCMIDNVQRMQ